MNDVSLREALRRAHAEREERRQTVAAALSAATRGAELVASLEGELEGVRERGVSATIIRSSELVEWAKRGAPLPNGRDARLVDSASEIRVGGELNAALAARADLLRAIHAAEAALADAEAAVTRSATAIVLSEAATLAADYVEAQRRAWTLRDRLEGLRAVWLPGRHGAAPGPIAISETILNALAVEREPLPGNIPAPAVWATRLYSDWHKRLADDPAAEFEARDPEPLQLPAHMLRRTLFRAQGDVEAERLAEQRAAAAEAMAQADMSIPAVAESAIRLATERGQMPR